jgi:hypothetical protein
MLWKGGGKRIERHRYCAQEGVGKQSWRCYGVVDVKVLEYGEE